jgi:hypothetical protein
VDFDGLGDGWLVGHIFLSLRGIVLILHQLKQIEPPLPE